MKRSRTALVSVPPTPRQTPKLKWVIAFLVLAPLGGYWLAGQGGSAAVANAAEPAPPMDEQNTPPPTPGQEQPEVLSRGPVHEAFAEPVSLQSEAGLVAPQAPPASIEEVPPAERPQGQGVVWIPGYWSWDTDRNGYIWVSACWRVPPPRMSWVPGYWSRAPGGWEWIAGFWAPAGVAEIEYLPAPPAIDDADAYGSAPSPDTIWVPPCMYWVQGQYVRRAGYWLAAQPNWLWVPSHYVVTPRGYIFAPGHWDYALERRGVLFAPVYLSASVYGRAGFFYSPSIVIDVGLLRVNLFAYPRYNHYYFGDYYDDAYVRIGIYPWFDSRRHHSWYDPVFEHDRWDHHRTDPRWETHERDQYDRRRADVNLRPARTFRAQESRLAKLPEPQRRALQVTQPLSVAVTNRANPLRFERIDPAARQTISKQAAAVRTFRDERTQWESTVAGPNTIRPPKEHGGAAAAPPEHTETIKAPKGHGGTAMPPPERTETVQYPREHGGTAPPPAERTATIKAPKDHGGTDTAPPDRRATGIPAVQREPASVPPREANLPRPERVQIPMPPGGGGSAGPGVFQKGPPGQSDNEDNNAKDSRKGRDRDTRRDGDDRRGN